MQLAEALKKLRAAGLVPELRLAVGEHCMHLFTDDVSEEFMRQAFEVDAKGDRDECDRQIAELDAAVKALIAGGFDSVMIFAQVLNNSGTGAYVGHGNYYARWAQIREWVLQQDIIAKRETPK